LWIRQKEEKDNDPEDHCTSLRMSERRNGRRIRKGKNVVARSRRGIERLPLAGRRGEVSREPA